MYLRLRICWGPLVGTGNPSRNCTNGTLVCGRRQTCLLVVSAAAHHIPQHAPLWQGIRMAQVEPAAPRWLHPYPRENRARAVTRRVKISSRVATCMRRCRSAAPRIPFGKIRQGWNQNHPAEYERWVEYRRLHSQGCRYVPRRQCLVPTCWFGDRSNGGSSFLW